MPSTTPLGAVVRGLVAATIGTGAMDLQHYISYRRGGGPENFLRWEFGGIDNWDQVSVPGKVGLRLIEAWIGRTPSPKWAGVTNNVMHWGFGIQWGALYGIVAGSKDPPPIWLGPPFGALVWLFGYAVLPIGHFYKPIWEYDAETLARDLASHLVYGTVTGISFRLLSGDR